MLTMPSPLCVSSVPAEMSALQTPLMPKLGGSRGRRAAQCCLREGKGRSSRQRVWQCKQLPEAVLVSLLTCK